MKFIEVKQTSGNLPWGDGRLPFLVLPNKDKVYYSTIPGDHHFRLYDAAWGEGAPVFSGNIWPEYAKGHVNNHPELQAYADGLLAHLGLIPEHPGRLARSPW